MAGHQRDVDVAGFADRFAVVEGFEHGKKARLLLQVTGDGIKPTRAAMTAEGLPAGQGGAGGGHRGVDVGLGALGHLGELAGGGRIEGGEKFTFGARQGETTVDEMTETATVALEPGDGGVGRFRCFAVTHVAISLENGHVASPTPGGDGNPPNNGR